MYTVIFVPVIFPIVQLSFMGLNRLEDEENVEEESATTNGYLPPDAWQRVAKRVECCFRTAPSFHYM